MPTYEFKCLQCGDVEELVTSLYSNHTVFCMDCGVDMEKQFTSPGIIFKGEGWASKKKALN